MAQLDIVKLNKSMSKYPEVKIVYLFGSQATGTAGSLSDHDFAVYLDTRDKTRIAELQLDLISDLTDVVQSDKVDLSILNLNESPEFKYNVIKEGKIVYEVDDYRVMVEPRIITEYCDFRMMLKNNNLLPKEDE